MSQTAQPIEQEPAPLTRRERVAVHDAIMRKRSAASAAAGKGPLPRADYALLLAHTLPTTILVWTQGKRLHAMVTGPLPTELSGATRVDELVCHASHYPVVCADPDTRKRLSQALGSNPKLDHLEVRARQYEASIKHSAWMADLTQHLAHNFWTPKGREPGDLTGWATSFGLSIPAKGVDGTVMAALLDRLPRTDIRGTAKTGPVSYRTQAVDLEAKAARSYAFGGLAGKCEAHSAAERRAEIIEAITSIDPALVERNVIAGAVAKAMPLQIAGVSKLHLVDGGLAFDREVIVFGDTSSPGPFAGTASVARWRGLEVNRVGETLGMVGWTKRQSDLAEALHKATRRPVYIAKAAYLGRAASAPRGEDIDKVDRVKREMPVEVLIAGAPTD